MRLIAEQTWISGRPVSSRMPRPSKYKGKHEQSKHALPDLSKAISRPPAESSLSVLAQDAACPTAAALKPHVTLTVHPEESPIPAAVTQLGRRSCKAESGADPAGRCDGSSLSAPLIDRLRQSISDDSVSETAAEPSGPHPSLRALTSEHPIAPAPPKRRWSLLRLLSPLFWIRKGALATIGTASACSVLGLRLALSARTVLALCLAPCLLRLLRRLGVDEDQRDQRRAEAVPLPSALALPPSSGCLAETAVPVATAVPHKQSQGTSPPSVGLSYPTSATANQPVGIPNAKKTRPMAAELKRGEVEGLRQQLKASTQVKDAHHIRACYTLTVQLTTDLSPGKRHPGGGMQSRSSQDRGPQQDSF